MPSHVFLSSTYSDLQAHREAAQRVIRRLDAVDISMENFGARDQRPVAECKRLIQEESDLFVGIYAHRYGFVPKGSDKSITELEYAAAADAGLTRLIYVVDSQQPWVPGYIDGGESAEKLKAFKDSLLANHICQSFRGPDELATSIAADVGKHLAMQRATPVGRDIPVKDIGIDSIRGPVDENSADDWNKRRDGIYEQRRKVFLTHIIRPSAKQGQLFDVFIYLIRHKSTSPQIH